VQVGSDSTWIAGSVGFNSTCAIKSNGTLWCWGDNSYGQLGNGSTDASLVPAQSTRNASIPQVHKGTMKSYAMSCSCFKKQGKGDCLNPLRKG
jgi:alpha-tubulin suppressor-like RCC1 family protein